jgi:hypothetical protein
MVVKKIREKGKKESGKMFLFDVNTRTRTHTPPAEEDGLCWKFSIPL